MCQVHKAAEVEYLLLEARELCIMLSNTNNNIKLYNNYDKLFTQSLALHCPRKKKIKCRKMTKQTIILIKSHGSFQN